MSSKNKVFTLPGYKNSRLALLIRVKGYGIFVGEIPFGDDALVSLQKEARLKGRVIGPDGEVVPFAKVMLGSANWSVVQGPNKGRHLMRTNERGEFELGGLSEHTKVVTVYDEVYGGMETVISVKPGEILAQDIHFEGKGALAGQVSVGGTVVELKDVYINLISEADDRSLHSGDMGFHQDAENEHGFLLDRLPAGQLKMIIRLDREKFPNYTPVERIVNIEKGIVTDIQIEL